MAMELTVVTVSECPNAPALEERLAQVLAELDAGGRVSITRHTVTDAGQAARWQMRGSPTLLVDGIDPFADPSVPTGLACRMYRDEHGRLEGAPSVAALRRVLGQALAGADGLDRSRSMPVRADALGRAGAGRMAPVAGGLRAVHQRVLHGFADTGAAPSTAELHTADLLRLSRSGQIRAAYPFSAVPTPHHVRIDRGPQVFAMCAIDALGMAAMLGRDVCITSTDPSDGQHISVNVTPSGQPGTAVVFAGQQSCCEPYVPGTSAAAAAEVCCGYINFFAGPATARAWAGAHPQVSGQVLDQASALQLGVTIFGPLLSEPIA